MLGRRLRVFLTISILPLFLLAAIQAAEPQIHKGVVVSAEDGRLVMKDAGGKEHGHLVGKEAKITVNGKPGRLEDLKAGAQIRVTTETSDKVIAVATVDDDK